MEYPAYDPKSPVGDVVELTKELIAFKSTWKRPGEIGRCADFIEAWLKEMDVPVNRVEHNGVPSIYVLPKETHAPVLLMAHFDVVEVEGESLFEPRIEDGVLYGRGSIDDKYAVALSMILFRDQLAAIRADGGDLSDMPFGILFTGDEETGGHYGAGETLKSITTDFCMALDGGAPNKIVTKEKGVLQLRLSCKGKACHGSRPWMGHNPFFDLSDDLRIIEKHFPDTGDTWRRTMNIGIVKMGDTINKVPAEATAELDIRYTENDDLDSLIPTLQEAVSGTLEVLAREPIFLGGESRYLDKLLEVVPEARTAAENGASDARFLSAKGIPGVVWGPEDGSTCHAENERMVLDSLQFVHDRMSIFLAGLR